MQLTANVRLIRTAGNLFVLLYCLVAVGGYFSTIGMVGSMQNVASQAGGGGVQTSFYAQFYTIGFIGVALSLFGLFLVWKLFHLFLDMYEAIAKMQQRTSKLSE